MASAKQYKLFFQLTAALGPNFSQSFKSASNVMKTMQSDIKTVNSKLKDVSAYQKQQTAVDNSKKRVDELQGEYDKLVNEIGDVENATKEQKKALENSAKALTKAKDAAVEEEHKLSQMSDALKAAGVNTDNLSKSTQELEAEYERLQKAQEKVQKISEKQEINNAAISQTKGQLVGLVGTVAAVGTAIYNGPVKKAAEFQEQMSTVKAIAGSVESEEMPQIVKLASEMGLAIKEGANDTETAMNILAEKAKAMGASTKYTATEAGQAMEYMAMAGWKVDDMLNGIEGVMNLAAASGEDLASTSDIVTDALTALGMTAEDTNKFVDILAATATSSNTDVGMLGESFQYVAATAGTLGYSAEDLSIALGTMANSGVKGTQAGNALKTALARMAAPTDAVASAMDSLGISMTDSEGNTKSLMGVMQDLRKGIGSVSVDLVDSEGNLREYDDIIADLSKTTEGLSQVQQIEAASTIFGKNAMAGMLTIVNAGEGDFQALTDSIYDSKGAAEEMAAIKLDNLNGDITLMKSAWDALNVSLGEMLMPTLRGVVQRITEVLNTANDFVKNNPGIVKMIAGIVAGLTGMKAGGLIAKLGFLQVKGGVLSLQKVFTQIKGLGITKYLSGIGGGFGGILTKILPIVGVIAAVGAAIYMVSTHLDEVRGFIQKTFGDEGLAVFDKLWEVITQVGGALKDAFFTSGTGVLDTLKEIIPTIVSTLQTGLLPLLPMIADLVMQILPLVGQLVTAILPVLGTLISTVITVLASLVAEVLPVIVSLISAILPLVVQIIQSVLPVFIDLVNTIVPILVQIIEAVLPVIIQLIQTLLPIITQIIEAVLPVVINLLNTLLPIFTTIIEAILPPLSALLQALIPVIQLVAQVFASVLGSALQSISTIVQNVMQIFQGLIDFITGVFTGNWSQAWNGIKSIFSGAVGGLGEIIKAPLRAVVSAVNTVIGGLNKLKVPDWVPGLGGKGINIPLIPGFAKGTERTPDTFVAGENGPELVTNAAGRKVYNAAQTGRIFANMAQAENLNNSASGVNASLSGAGTITLHVSNSPTIVVQNGGDTENLKSQLAQYDEEFLEKIRTIIVSILKDQKEQEGRVAYA